MDVAKALEKKEKEFLQNETDFLEWINKEKELCYEEYIKGLRAIQNRNEELYREIEWLRAETH